VNDKKIKNDYNGKKGLYMKLKQIIKILTKRIFPLFRKDIQKITINNQKIKYIHFDKGTPYTIVFENGLGTGMAFWDNALLELAKEHSVFAYSRPLKEELKIMKEGWQSDAEDVISNIKKVLDRCKIKTPYILVGHSLGGLYVQLFAKAYPESVKAMVLVDGTYPDEFSDMEAMKVPPKLQKTWKYLSKNTTDIGQGLLTSPITKQVPIMILSALLKEDIEGNPEWNEMITCMHKKQENYLSLYPWAKQVWVDSGHNIHFEKPEMVVDTVRRVIDAN